jgi:lipopolysaccharide/colanic/teichoic acid biosynthesis glycosyltransferase
VKPVQRILKRATDIVAALLGLVLLSPVLLIVALLVRRKLGRPVLFRQKRPGLHGRPFLMCKFRTMTDERDDQGNPVPDEQRLTRFGRRLRSTSLDELPELLNVLKGEMSLVGPRPLRMHYLPRYNQRQARRHDVKPGITGWAMVNGRNSTTWEERFELDVWYVDHWSYWLDLRILCRTIWTVVRREGVNPEGDGIMPDFMGSEEPQRDAPDSQADRDGR